MLQDIPKSVDIELDPNPAEQSDKMLCFDGRVDYHTRQNMQCTIKGNHFGSAYFCRNLLPTKLELRKLNKYDRPLIQEPFASGE